ncbi:diguanylate cyclase [Candidatus Thiodiazotropha sp. CDECU1]|uniref:diguanylate cyclase n=1 Tax=Candidatus Thiodiazotropha sp. CDECU1 TaxID=3065865 RepID=UPI0029308F24|nr:diguanylate cyclase [Candidatus Thiodiazotropha sp. CDECU1]
MAVFFRSARNSLRHLWMHTAHFAIGFSVWLLPLFCQADPPPVRSASELDYPPFSVVHEDNSAGGFSVELMQAAVQAMGREVTFAVGPWADIKQDLEAGHLEALPLVGRTPEREAFFDFTVPYISLYGAVFVRDDENRIKVPEDLAGRSVGVLQGDNAEEYVRREGITDRIVATRSYEDAFMQLSEGDIDAVVAQRLVGLTLIDKLGLNNITTAIAPLPGLKQDFCFAVTEGNKELLALLNEGLSVVIANGTYEQIREKWLGILDREKNQKLLYFQVATGLMGSISLILLALFAYQHWKEHRNLKINEVKFRTLFENMAQGAFYQRADGVLLDINRAGLELFGITRDQFLGRTSMDPQWKVIREDGSEIPGEQHPSMQALRTGKPVKGTILGVFNPQREVYVWLNITAIPQFMPGENSPYQAFVTMHDISARKETEERLKQQATHDPLTGLYNRKELETRLTREIARCIRYNHRLSVFMLDIDHFKRVNDQYGHQIGDTVLTNLTSLFERSIRKTDFSARYGGEEFVIVLSETPLDQAKDLAERLRKRVADHPIRLENNEEINLTISIGVATYPDHAESWKELIKSADMAMYAAKKAGRNQVKTADNASAAQG